MAKGNAGSQLPRMESQVPMPDVHEPKQDPESEPGVVQGGDGTITVTLRHKTGHHAYRRVGLVIGRVPKDYNVTSEQLEVLNLDPHVEVVQK